MLGEGGVDGWVVVWNRFRGLVDFFLVMWL